MGYLFTYVGPLAFVLMVTLSKEALDDIARRKRDRDANAQLYTVLRGNGETAVIPSSALQVGDVVEIHKGDRIPADIVLLRTSGGAKNDGTCFVRTEQLDGETDWKLRIAVPSVQRLPEIDALFRNSCYVYGNKHLWSV